MLFADRYPKAVEELVGREVPRGRLRYFLGPDDVALGISHTGASRDVTDALGRARAHGATTIGITHRPSSPITKVSDIVLVTAAQQTAFRSDASSSRIAQLTIIDVLYVGVAHVNHERSLSMIERTREATAAKRY